MRKSEHEIILRLTGVAVFSALAFVLTAYCQIPYAGEAGYFNFGDVVTLFVAMVYGPLEGALVGIVAGSMGDFVAGYAAYIPFTVLAKGIMGLATGVLFVFLRKRRIMRFASPFVGATLMILVYMAAYAVLIGQGVYLGTAFDCVQGYGMAILSIPLTIGFFKTGFQKRLDRDETKGTEE
ncbi:MAG: ECF transporter S component [Bacilli bacterium]|jgi:uncharacterized membrane protein|nr:ECF transporter S component [Bacilli bacterium]